MKSRTSLLHSWLETVGTSAAIQGLGLLTGVLTARLLGPDERGLLAAAMFWPGLIASLAFLSVGEAVVYRRTQTQLSCSQFMATAAALSMLLSFIATVCVVMLLPRLLGAERLAQIPLIYSYAIPFLYLHLIASTIMAVRRSEQKFRSYNALRFLNPLSYLIGIMVILLFANLEPQNFLWAALFGTAVNMLFCLWTAGRDLLAIPCFHESAKLLRQGVAFHGATVLALLSVQADRVVLMAAFGNAEIGKYVVALTLASTATVLITSSANTVLFPSIAAIAEGTAKVEQLQNSIRRTWLAVVAISLVSAVFFPPLLPLVFGEAFEDGRPLVAVLALATAPITIRQVALTCLRAFGDGRTAILVELGAIISFIVMVMPALSINQTWAVGAAFGFANAIAMVLTAFLLRSRYGIPAAAWLLPSARMTDDVRLIFTQLQRWRSV